jgi:hypothetical protein
VCSRILTGHAYMDCIFIRGTVSENDYNACVIQPHAQKCLSNVTSWHIIVCMTNVGRYEIPVISKGIQ